jgi:hypothetical protein
MKDKIFDMIWSVTIALLIMAIILGGGIVFILVPAMLIIRWLGISY